MFPIRWNFPFRKKDGSISTIGDEISAGGGGGGYELPTATASRLGGVKIGSGITVQEDGTISASGGSPYELPTASEETKGGVKIGSGLSMDGEVLNNSNPTPYSLPTASAETLGGVKVGSGLSITDGVLSASGGSGGGLTLTPIDLTSHTGAEFSVNNVDLTGHDGLAFALDANKASDEFVHLQYLMVGSDSISETQLRGEIYTLSPVNGAFPRIVYRMVTLNISTKVLTVSITNKLDFSANNYPTTGTQNNIGRVNGIFYVDYNLPS